MDPFKGTLNPSVVRSSFLALWLSGFRLLRLFWALVKGFNLSYHNKETNIIGPYYGNLSYHKIEIKLFA